MARPMLSEWNNEELIYVEPTQVVRSFGYERSRKRTPETIQAIKNSAARAAEADGPVAFQRVEFNSPEEATKLIKQRAIELGGEQVGIACLDQRHVYKGEDVPHEMAVVVAVSMPYEMILQTPSPESSYATMHTYDVTGGITTELAKEIRAMGYPARAHTLRFEQINMLPHAYNAGLGELGKHGSLINRELGCSFRVSVVTTDLPLVVDVPKREGIDDFCSSCQMCTQYCPGDAISSEKQEVRGTVKWVVDTEACAPYWAEYYACGICLQVCPLNAKAFDGKFQQDFVKTIKNIDLPLWREELKDGLQEPWAFVEPPTELSENWRMGVKGADEKLERPPSPAIPNEII